MIIARTSLWTLRLFFGFMLLAGTALAQDALPTKNSEAVSEVSARLSKEARGIPPEDLPRVKQQFQLFAKYYGDLIASPAFYKASLDPKLGAPPPRIPTMDRNIQTGILTDMDRYILEPTPTSKVVNEEKIDYIREMGIAFDG